MFEWFSNLGHLPAYFDVLPMADPRDSFYFVAITWPEIVERHADGHWQ
ncbi:hypothetical protein HMPREF0307_00871 [Corynebacterium sp. DNF00584]|nr:hypothetical protein HMPREF0307_00871 [Corynebacterium sp. DNF00584]